MTSITIFLGEGNFSFSTSLAFSPDFSSLNTTMIASDLAPELQDIFGKLEAGNNVDVSDQTQKKMKSDIVTLRENISVLKSLGHTVLLDVDATKIHKYPCILDACKKSESDAMKVFVVFNFPHVKCKKMKIGLNRDLLRDFFKSCDGLHHVLNEDEKNLTNFEVIPVVSLCAGQSGIPEVDKVAREWGDSWQINDMAAHGNFVCVSICNFEDWRLYGISKKALSPCPEKSTYKSSCYRLQGAVGFTTENALTLTYQHREHVNPNQTDRLKSIFIRSNPNTNWSMNLLRHFSPILEEKISFSWTSDAPNEEMWRNYNHLAIVARTQGSIQSNVQNYFNDGETETKTVKVVNDKIYVHQSGKEYQVGIVKECENIMALYVDRFVELKFNEDYRHILSREVSRYPGRSMYPRIHKFHLSFWLSSKFSFDSFIETLLDVYGLMMKGVELLEEYENELGRKSLCWRFHIQSLDQPLSRHCAHDMYLKLREELHNRLDVEVR